MMKSSFSAAGISLFCTLALLGCSDDSGGPDSTACQAGQQCPCTTTADCPATEFCSVAFVCLPDTDAGTDTGEDIVADAPSDGTTDTAEPDTTDTDTDTEVEDTDVPDTIQPDTTDVSDPDVADVDDATDDVADTTDTSDVVEDIDTSTPDTGVVPSTDDNPWIAYVSGGGVSRNLRFILADGSELRELVTDDAIIQAPVFSPDCTRVAYIGASLDDVNFAIRIVDLTAADSVVSTVAVAETFPQELSWSPDGNTLAVVQNDSGAERELVYLDATTLNVTPRLSNRRVLHARFAGSASTVYIRATPNLASSTVELYALPFAAGEPVQLTTNSASIGDFGVSEDGKLFAFQRNSGGPEFALWDRDADNYTDIGQPQDGDASFFADGERLAITRIAGGAPNLFVVDLDGDELVQLTDTTIQLSEPSVCRLDSSLVDITAATVIVP